MSVPSVSPIRVRESQRALLVGQAVGLAAALLDVLGAVRDRRWAQGRRYGLASVLALWFAGVLAGQQTFTARSGSGRRLSSVGSAGRPQGAPLGTHPR